MKEFIICMMIFVGLIIVYVIWQRLELKKFEITKYELGSDKIKKEHQFVVLADLHGFEYGDNNQKLIRSISEQKPQFILIAGDMIVTKYPKTYSTALQTLSRLVKIAPVYYAMGNHESRANREESTVYPDFIEYCNELERMGIVLLKNQNIKLQVDEDEIWVGGLEIELDYYKKGCIVPMEHRYISQRMEGQAEKTFQILLAHNPAYSEQYASWGADVTFCGHNHGGLIRIPGIGSLMSPQLTWFPKYNDGCHDINGRKVIISRGLGTHTYHIRIFNRAELINVRIFPNTLEKCKKN